MCVVFQIGLALFKIAETEILKVPQHDGTDIILTHMERTLQSGNEDILFKMAFKEFSNVTVDHIKELRNMYKSVVLKEMEINKKKNEEWELRHKRDAETTVTEVLEVKMQEETGIQPAQEDAEPKGEGVVAQQEGEGGKDRTLSLDDFELLDP